LTNYFVGNELHGIKQAMNVGQQFFHINRNLQFLGTKPSGPNALVHNCDSYCNNGGEFNTPRRFRIFS
jgi:hypothetical protein